MNKYNKNFALPNELWKDVVGYEGLYQVSTMGRVRSLNYHRTGKEKIRRPANIGGYLYIILWKNGKGKNHSIHRLVAQAWLKPVAGKDCVNHLDEVKDSNHYSNLEYCTPKENANWGTCIQRRIEKQINGKQSKAVYQYTLDGQFIKEYPSTMEVCRQTGFYSANISRCCNGKLKTAYGFKWSYKKSQNL